MRPTPHASISDIGHEVRRGLFGATGMKRAMGEVKAAVGASCPNRLQLSASQRLKDKAVSAAGEVLVVPWSRDIAAPSLQGEG